MAESPRRFFEVQTHHGAYWLVARSCDSLAEAEEAAERASADRVGLAVQLVRCEEMPGFEHVLRTVLRRLGAPGAVPEPAAPLVVPGTDPTCRDPADLRSDRGREGLASALGRWLDENRLTPIELLHSDRHARRLFDAGVVLQGALQKVAVAQVRGSDVPVQRRFKDLLALSEAALAELLAESKAEPAPELAPGAWGAFCAALAARVSGPDLRARQFRALAAWLEPERGWAAKAERLGLLVEPGLPERDLMPIDALLAEILGGTGAAAEIAGAGADRAGQVMALLGFLAGRAGPDGNAEAGPGLRALAGLAGAGLAPRTRTVVRRRIAAEIHGTAPLQAAASLFRYAEALHDIRDALAASPGLGEDAELADLLERRAFRAINPDSVHACLCETRVASERFRMLVRLAGLMPYASGKAKLLEFAKGTYSVDDVVREGAGAARDRAAAIPLLVDLHREVTAAEIDPDSKALLQGQLDGALLDILRNEVMNAPGRGYFDRVLGLIKLCGATPLPEGRARALAAETVGRAVGSAEFLGPFLGRFKTEPEKRQALNALKGLLVAAGIGRAGAPAGAPARAAERVSAEAAT
jgi:hypothetical protein